MNTNKNTKTGQHKGTKGHVYNVIKLMKATKIMVFTLIINKSIKSEIKEAPTTGLRKSANNKPPNKGKRGNANRP